MEVDDLFMLSIKSLLNGGPLVIDLTLQYHGNNDEERHDHRAENGVGPYHHLGDAHVSFVVVSLLRS